MLRRTALSMLLLLGTLTGCGGGGGSDSGGPDRMPGGIYEGTLRSAKQGKDISVFGMVGEDGRAHVFDPATGAVHASTVTENSDRFNWTIRAYSPAATNQNLQSAQCPSGFFANTLLSTGSATGTILERQKLTGTYDLRSAFAHASEDDAGELLLNYQLEYNTAVRLADLQGVWNATMDGKAHQLGFNDTSGKLSGGVTVHASESLTYACNWSGTFHIIDLIYNAYAVHLVEQCPVGVHDRAHAYEYGTNGIAVYYPPTPSSNARLVVGVANETYAGTVTFIKE